MNRIQLAQNLYLDEYIPKDMYTQYEGREHILIGLLDKRLIMADQWLRDHFGPMTINNWYLGGERQWSGLRIVGSPQYSPTSQHSFGRASDKIFKEVTAEEVREFIRINHSIGMITCIEKNVSWVHSDVRQLWNTDFLEVSA